MYSLMSYNFGNLFRTARKAKGLSIEEIASKIKRQVQYINMKQIQLFQILKQLLVYVMHWK